MRACARGGCTSPAPGNCRLSVCLGGSAAASWPLFTRPGDCRQRWNRPVFPELAASTARWIVAPHCPGESYSLESRGLALPVAHCCQLDVHLLHGPGFHTDHL